MTDAPAIPEPGLYVSDKEIGRRLGYCDKTWARIRERLERGIPNMRRYPERDVIFGRRFWPEVLQWHMDYHGVRQSVDQPSIAPAYEAA